jgi:hypothetical protein
MAFDTAVPTVTSLASTTANGTYRAGAIIDISVVLSEVVTVTTGTGTPTLLLETGATDRAATYTSGSGTNTLSFRYTVQSGDNSADLSQQSTSALALNGGVIADALGNNATLTLPGTTSATTGSLAANAAIVIDTQAPSAPTNVTISPVGGTVVDDDHPVGATRLHGQAFQRGLQEAFAIEDRDDGGEFHAGFREPAACFGSKPPQVGAGPVGEIAAETALVEEPGRLLEDELGVGLGELGGGGCRVVPTEIYSNHLHPRIRN